jgi:hypothetical protein
MIVFLFPLAILLSQSLFHLLYHLCLHLLNLNLIHCEVTRCIITALFTGDNTITLVTHQKTALPPRGLYLW